MSQQIEATTPTLLVMHLSGYDSSGYDLSGYDMSGYVVVGVGGSRAVGGWEHDALVITKREPNSRGAGKNNVFEDSAEDYFFGDPWEPGHRWPKPATSKSFLTERSQPGF